MKSIERQVYAAVWSYYWCNGENNGKCHKRAAEAVVEFANSEIDRSKVGEKVADLLIAVSRQAMED